MSVRAVQEKCDEKGLGAGSGHCNPVKHSLALEPEQWAWGSDRHYADGEHGPVLVNETQKAEPRATKIP